MVLSTAKKRQRYRIVAMPNEGAKLHALTEQGIFVGSELLLINRHFFKGPVAVAIQGTSLSVPYDIASDIYIEAI